MREQRRAKIMRAAVSEASRSGYRNMTRGDIAQAAGVAHGSINHEFGTMDALRDAVMHHAVAACRLDIVAQGLADGHAAARDAPAAMREAAVRALA
jgi:AcrR family transcriptional regulator